MMQVEQACVQVKLSFGRKEKRGVCIFKKVHIVKSRERSYCMAQVDLICMGMAWFAHHLETSTLSPAYRFKNPRVFFLLFLKLGISRVGV